jgi:N-acyl-D-aspartate/D-glutamate deacylase
VGRKLDALAAGWNTDAVEAAVRVLRVGDQKVASFNMDERDIRAFMVQPWVVTGSDGSTGHPRKYGTFPLKYARYVREQKLLSMQRFVRQSSGATADIFRLDRRGYLRPGYFADVVVLDPQRYAPRADYVHPTLLADGVTAAIVNGQVALQGGRLTGVAAGRGLAHTPPAGTCG